MTKLTKRQRWMHDYEKVVLFRYLILAGSIDWHKADIFYDAGYTPAGALAGMESKDIVK